jgi:hypothetical protein
MTRASVPAICLVDPARCGSSRAPATPDPRVDAPAWVSTMDGDFMPTAVSVLADDTMRMWCTGAVAAVLVGGPGFITRDRFPDLAIWAYLPRDGHTVTVEAWCEVTEARVSNDGGFVLELRVLEVSAESAAVMREFCCA